MSDSVDRRTLLKGAAASAAAMSPLGEALAAQSDGLQYDPPVPFTYDLFKTQARDQANGPYIPPPRPAPDVLQKINYEEWGKIRFRDDYALFADGPGRFPVTFFHLGLFFQKAVSMHVVEGGMSRQIIYEQSYFEMPANSPARDCRRARASPACASRRRATARSIGARTTGSPSSAPPISARSASSGNTAFPRAALRSTSRSPIGRRNFPTSPISTSIRAGRRHVTLYALMEGPSIVGAFRFLMTRGQGRGDGHRGGAVHARAISRFGIAPLTSMYWFSETKKETAIDWRPEVHDSDGLAMWTGNGERLWRPLNNPPRIMVSAFLDNNPRGFGLLQRDRVFDHYLDGVFYDRRPSLWVEPLPGPSGEGWGKGSIQLCEIPTDDEIHDNVVAMWVPAEPVPAGAELNLNYRLHWLADEPYPSKLAVAVSRPASGAAASPASRGPRACANSWSSSWAAR